MNKHANAESLVEDLYAIHRDERARRHRWRKARKQESRLARYRRLKSNWILQRFAPAAGKPEPGSAWGVPDDGRAFSPRFKQRRITPGRVLLSLLTAASVATAAHIVQPEMTEQVLAGVVRHVPLYSGVVDDIRLAARCSHYRLLLDRPGNPAALLQPSSQECRQFQPAFKSISIPLEQARPIVEALEAVEGRSTGWGSLLGVLDVPGTLKRLFEKLSGKRRHMTGTPPLLSAVEAMMKKAGAMNIRSKIPSVIATARFVSLEMPDRDSRISFMAASLQCLRGTTRGGFGSAPLAGGICIRMLFNKNPADTLELGERCLLAASFKSQIRIAAPGASLPARKRMQASLDKVKARTPGCINRLAKNDREARQALLFVDQYELPADLRAPAMARTAPGLDIPFADTVDLSSAGEIPTLTVNGEDQRALDEVLRSQLPELDRKLARGLCFSPACRGRNPDVAIVVAEIEDDSLVSRLAWSNRHRLVSGAAQPRSLGSVSKVPAILEIGQSGRVLLCNQKFGDIQNPGGDRGVAHCRDGLGLEAAEFSVKKSRNLPFINAMRGNTDHLRLLLSGLNWSFDATAGDDELVVGSVLGYGATATMAQHMQLMAALYRGAQGNPPQVRELSFLEKDMPAGAMLDLQALGYSQSGILKAGRLLSAPLEPGGTLTSLAPVLQRNDCGLGLAMGKSGSAETSRQTDATGLTAKTAILAFRCGRRDLVAMITIASPAGADIDIGALRIADIAPLFGKILGIVNRSQ